MGPDLKVCILFVQMTSLIFYVGAQLLVEEQN